MVPAGDDLMPVAPAARSTGTSRGTLVRVFRWAAVGTVTTYAVNLVILPFVLNRIGRELFGAWATIATVIAMGGLADIGIRTEVIRRVAAANGADDEDGLAAAVHQGMTLLVGLASALFLFGMVSAPAIRAFAFPEGVAETGPASLDLLIRAVFGLLALSLVINGFFGVLAGVQRADVESMAGAAAVPLGAAATVGGILWGWGLWALLAGAVVELAVLLGWKAVAVRRLVPALHPRLVRLTRAQAASYLGLSSLVFVCQLGDVFDFQWDKLMLSRFVGTAAVSSFQVATSLVMGARVLAQLPLAPMLTAAAELRQRDPERMETLFALLGKIGAVASAVILGGVFVFAPAFIRLWLGPEMAQAGDAARLLAVAVAISVIGAPAAFRALAEGWHRLAAASAISNIVVNGTLSAVLTIAIGFNGPLYGSIAGNALGLVVILVLVRRRLGDRFQLPPWRGLAVGTALALAAAASGLGTVTTWLSLGVTAAAYAAVVAFACIRAERLPLSSFRPAREPAR
ncbi:MAG: hypothetical protein QOG43_1894 [Actinomycetota bacterium]|jgi:O-antigen/teichoic acid export membrane protein|nr:hypothetical protein [Actinomycetota bacterium]